MRKKLAIDNEPGCLSCWRSLSRQQTGVAAVAWTGESLAREERVKGM